MSCSCCSAESKTNIIEPFIDRFALLTKCRLDNGAKHFRKPAIGPQSESWKSSKLQSLPTELYQACLSYLDIETLTAMRRVSQYTRYAIDSLYQYQELYEHAPQALRACLSTGAAPHIPVRRLHHALTSMECYYCKISSVPFCHPQHFTNSDSAMILNLPSAPTYPSMKAVEPVSSASAITRCSSLSS
jgi:hypothetical protein